MVSIRKANERGHTDHGWLKGYHTFSFGSYYDPKHTEFRSMRVLNEDWIEAGKGFPNHPHEDMEIITYIIDGELEHKDSMGNGSVIRRGELQRMTAGTGVSHSEFNHSDQTTHLLQIWITPERADLEPSYEQRDFSNHWKPNALTLIASQTGEKNSITVHQDVELSAGLLDAHSSLSYYIAPDRHVWIQLIKGALVVNGEALVAGDGMAVEQESALQIRAEENSEFLLFDLG